MLKRRNLGFVFEAQLVDETVDDVSIRDLQETISKVLRGWYGKVELQNFIGATAILRVPGRDLFKAEQVFSNFMNQFDNQWKQGASRRDRSRPMQASPGAPGPMAPLKMAYINNSATTWGRTFQEHTFMPGSEVPPVEKTNKLRVVDYRDQAAQVSEQARAKPKRDDYEDSEPCEVPAPKLFAVPKAPEAPPEPELAPMDPSQQAAYDRIINEPGHFFLTGKAGTGKSHVIKHLLKSKRCKATATTARAALIIGGTTVDRVFCFEREKWEIRGYDRLVDIMAECPPKIIIDEGSMAGVGMAGVISRVAKDFRKQLIIVGDLAQASPVKDEWLVNSELFQGIASDNHFLRLTESHRQSERPLLDALDSLRCGEVTDHVRAIFNPCIVHNESETTDQFIRLYATNMATDSYNARRLMNLPTIGASVTLTTAHTDKRPGHTRREYPLSPEAIEKQINDGSYAHNDSFKIGARVLMTKNDNGGGYVNGDAGTIVDILFADGTSARDAVAYNPFTASGPQLPVITIIVTLDRLGYDISIVKTTQTMKDASDRELYTLTGFPIRLGWAMSIHKAQGVTVDKAFVDMSTIMHMKGESKHGLAYVALSRTRTLAGLHIANWTDQAVYCSPIIKPYV